MRNHSTFGSRPRHSPRETPTRVGRHQRRGAFRRGRGPGSRRPDDGTAARVPAQTVTTALPTNTGEAAAAWLASQFTADGLLPGYAPGSADIGTTLQAIIGLAGVGTEQAQVLAAWAAVTADVDRDDRALWQRRSWPDGLLILAAVAIGAGAPT